MLHNVRRSVGDDTTQFFDDRATAAALAGFRLDRCPQHAEVAQLARLGQQAQFNFILVVGAEEEKEGTVNIRTRDNQRKGTLAVKELVANFEKLFR